MTRLALIVLIAFLAPATSAGALCGPASNPTRNGGISAVVALRVFDESAEPLPAVDEVYRTYIKPELDARDAKSTARNYKSAIAKFLAFLESGASTTSTRANPRYDDLTLLEWQQWCQSEGLKPATINKHWKQLRAIFRRMGPREKGNPKGLGLIDTVPHLAMLVQRKPQPVVIPTESIDAVYRYGCPDMSWPDSLPAASTCELWRTWMVCEWNLAMRTRDILRMEWSWIHWGTASLDPESPNESPFGWIEWVPAKTKHNKPDPLVLPLCEPVRRHLESIFDPRQAYVFGRQMARVSNRKLYGDKKRPGEWHRLIELTRGYAKIRPFLPKSIRSTANTQYNRLDRKLGAVVLGHAPRGVNDMFYQQWEADMIRFVGEYPQPPSFTRRLSPPVRQERLF